SEFVELINNSLSLSLNIEKPIKHTKNMVWNSEIFKYRCDVKTAYTHWKDTLDIKTKEHLESEMLKAKKSLKYAIRREERNRMKSLIGSIEILRSKDPSTYWKKLYQ